MTAEPAPLAANYFKAPVCRNCDAALDTPFCARCGQKQAARLSLRTLASETWERFRWFEFSVLTAAWRLIFRPGQVAREYVLGVRKRHVHPLKLLLIAIGVLLLVLARSRYLQQSDAKLGKAMQLIQAYGSWSFSLGIVAIALATLAVFWRRLQYNVTEHLVLAVYCHFLIICASILNLLPTLLVQAPAWLAAHRAFSAIYMGALEAGIVMLACQQFFLIDWRRQWWRLLLAGAVFVVLKLTLLRLFAILLVKIVIAQTH
ncbi:MAG: DUF3667 domain-containing protein [Arenimonas sp.]